MSRHIWIEKAQKELFIHSVYRFKGLKLEDLVKKNSLAQSDLAAGNAEIDSAGKLSFLMPTAAHPLRNRNHMER